MLVWVFPGTRAVWEAVMSGVGTQARLHMLSSEDVSCLGLPTDQWGTCLLLYKALVSRFTGTLIFLIDWSVCRFAPMLLIWWAGSIRFWRIDLASPFLVGRVTCPRSWLSVGSQEPWPVWGQRDDSDCFYIDCVEIGHFFYIVERKLTSLFALFYYHTPHTACNHWYLIINLIGCDRKTMAFRSSHSLALW